MSDLGVDTEWLWLVGGVALLIAEVAAPGFSLIFIGAAAIVTGLVSMAVPISVPLQFGVFAVLAIAAARFGGRRFYAARYDYSASPHLNDRITQLIGRVVVVVEPVDRNGGRVKLGDSVWSARGGPAQPGERVRIVDVEGNCLKVEPEHVLPSA